MNILSPKPTESSKRKVKTCGAWSSSFDTRTGKRYKFQIKCNNWRKCANCFADHVAKYSGQVWEMYGKFGLLCKIEFDPDDEDGIERLRRDLRGKFPYIIFRAMDKSYFFHPDISKGHVQVHPDDFDWSYLAWTRPKKQIGQPRPKGLRLNLPKPETVKTDCLVICDKQEISDEIMTEAIVRNLLLKPTTLEEALEAIKTINKTARAIAAERGIVTFTIKRKINTYIGNVAWDLEQNLKPKPKIPLKQALMLA